MTWKMEQLFCYIETILKRVCRFITGAAFAVLIFSVLVQVVGRTTGFSIVWTEELTRFSMLYMVAFGIGLALISGDLVNVDVLCNKLPDRLPIKIRFLVGLIIVCFCLLLLAPSLQFTGIGKLQTSPAIGLRMNFVHVTMFILPFLLSIFAAIRVIRMSIGTIEAISDNQVSKNPQETPTAGVGI